MIAIKTNKPIAIDSPDHITPVGTKNDNSISSDFNRRLFERIPAKQVRLLDLGCAGGGLVASILNEGGFAVGVEGSDYSKNLKRAEWGGRWADNLVTADITKPFDVSDNGHSSVFNVITAWEVMEHIRDQDIQAVADNILWHLDAHGFFIASIANFEDWQDGVNTGVHQCVHDWPWWVERFEGLGFRRSPEIERWFDLAVVRLSSFHLAFEAA